VVVRELFAKLGLEVDHGVFGAAEKALGNLKLGTLAIGSALAAVGGAMYHLMGETRDYAVEASKAAQRTGLAVEAWQELKAAGEATGTSAETLEHALVLMSKAAYGASEGSQEMVDTFSALGVHTKDASGHLKAGDELLEDLAEKFHNMPDGIKKTALATKAFGRSGYELLPFLNKGSEGIAELRHHAHTLGLVLDGETIAAAKKWKQEMREMSERIEGLKLQIGAKLLRAFMSFKESLGKVFKVLRGGFDTFARHWKSTVAILIAGALGVAAANAAASASYVVLGAKAVWAALKAAASWVLAAAPIVGLVALVAGLVLLWEDFLVFLEGGDSLIGELGPKWAKFVDEFLRDDPDDWWVTKQIKAALRALTDLDGFFRKVFKAGDGVKYDPGFKPTEGNGLPSGGISGWLKRAAGLEIPVTPDMLRPVGPTASPNAGGVSMPLGKPVTVHAPQVKNEITVNAAPGMSAEDVADHVAQKVGEHLDSVMRETAPAVR
jgi:hypothetical protein